MALKKTKINPNAGLASPEVMKAAEIVSRVDDAVKDIVAVPRNLIAVHENNDYRELDSEETIAQLADAIRRQGLLDNLVVVKRPSTLPGNEGKKYVLLSGERRFRAISMLCEESDELASQYATIPCNVISEDFFKLPEETMRRLHNDGYSDAEIRNIQEIIIIDEANLQRRGGVGDEVLQRKATYRYSQNLTIIYGLSQEQADEITKQISGQNIRTTIRNLKIERDLVSSLKSLLDKGLIKKVDAEKLGSMPVEIQETIGESLSKYSDLLGATMDNTPPEYIEVRESLTDVLSIRNKLKQQEAIDQLCESVKKKSEEIIREKAPRPKKNVTDNMADKYKSRVSLIRTRIKNLSTPHSIKQMKALNIVSGEDSVCEEIDAAIEDLQALKNLLLG